MLERNPPGVTYGWGVVFWDDLLHELRASDPATAREISRSSFRWSGELLAVGDRDRVRGEGDGYGIGRQRLLDLLVEQALDLGVHVQFASEVEHFSQLPSADVIVGCDGVNSRVRKLHEDHFATRVRAGRNKYIWCGTSKVFDAFTFAFVQTDAGWIWCHAYGFDDENSTFIVECSPETWHGLGFDRMDEEDTINLLKQLFASHLDGHPLRSHSRASGGAPWLNFRTLTNATWHHDNTVLMGDAAHTTHFTIGSGTKLALEDAITLADKVRDRDDLHPALEAYEAERKKALRPRQSDAQFSRLWFENIPRYAELDPGRFFALLRERRSPLLPRVPPPLYYRAYQATHKGPLRSLRKWAAPKIKALFFGGPF
ncbi:MAG TPA: FAD-dependent monooxygenase [Gaiellaceae bacterium]|nr:FAD-dependent monooxygenase [Gaiellaceae bacterium]